MAAKHCGGCVAILIIIVGVIQVAVSSSDPRLDALLRVFLSPPPSVNSSAKVSRETCDGKCYPEIGCSHGVSNCLSIAFGACSNPEPLENIDTKFLFFSKSNQYDPYIVNYTLSENEIENAPFNTNFFTVVLVHGYDDNYTENTSLGPIKNLYLNKMKNANIIAVDWPKGASNPNYQTGKANSLVVGAQIALLIEKLDKIFGLNLEQTIFIGFSLGGQVVGYAGNFTYQRLNKKIARIIGLDAAGICYDHRIFWHHDPEGLNPNHATLVESVHTNSAPLGYGYRGHEGHYDYFPNGGDHQPGCVTLEVVLSLGFEKSYCSHLRKQDLYFVDYEYFGECQPVAYNCSTYKHFEKGLCGSCEQNQCQLMSLGIQVSNEEITPNVPQKTNFNLFLKTTDKLPFCIFHFQLKASVKYGYKPKTIDLKLIGKSKNETMSLIAGPFADENNYYSLLTIAETTELNKTPGPFESAVVLDYFIENNKAVNVIEKLEINYMSNIKESIRSSHSTILCPKSTNTLSLCTS